MNSSEIRSLFIKFFKNKKHFHHQRSLVVNKKDPTLMFTNAGMNQFKSFFINPSSADHSRVVTIQPCIRVSGKHNDLEEVGVDTYHHTLFEMMGNWSFGDFFKKEAIEWAWELLTEVYKIDKNRIYITTFGGDEEENLEKDFEAYEIWRNLVDEKKIIHNESKKNNFWEMGDTGPCGPSTEIHIDIRSEDERKKIDGYSLVNKDHPEVIEIWNLVFIEYERLSSGKLNPLKKKCIDTGMGFERLAMILQDKKSTYDTDVFIPMIKFLEKKKTIKYGAKKDIDIAIRVIVDHIRTIVFAIGDGQIPSNNKAGYVIRRILRRALRYGYSFLNFDEPFLFELCNFYIKNSFELDDNFKKNQDYIAKIIYEEEVSFLKTLEIGIAKLNNIIDKSESKIISGKNAFDMFDTYGFPIDITTIIAKEKNFLVDLKGFESEMKNQKERSKQNAKKSFGDWIILDFEKSDTDFLGYQCLSSEIKIIKYRKCIENDNESIHLVFDKTPFYPEGGGQIGDSGYLVSSSGEKIYIFNTKKENGIIIHEVNFLPKNLNENFFAQVDEKKRERASAHHTATHLLHAVLREVFGKNVEQKGSAVTETKLRLDFSYHDNITQENLIDIEKKVNEIIREDFLLEEIKDVNIKDAEKMGAMALFEEKYGEKVRVIKFGEVSTELCGGTHALSTGKLGYFKIISSSSIGVKRIEAKVGSASEDYINEKFATIKSISEKLKYPQNIDDAVEKLLLNNKTLKKDLEKYEDLCVEFLIKDLSENKIACEKFNLVVCENKKINFETNRKVVIASSKNKKTVAISFFIKDDRFFVLIGASNDLKNIFSMNKFLDELRDKYNFLGGGKNNFTTINFDIRDENKVKNAVLTILKSY